MYYGWKWYLQGHNFGTHKEDGIERYNEKEDFSERKKSFVIVIVMLGPVNRIRTLLRSSIESFYMNQPYYGKFLGITFNFTLDLT